MYYNDEDKLSFEPTEIFNFTTKNLYMYAFDKGFLISRWILSVFGVSLY